MGDTRASARLTASPFLSLFEGNLRDLHCRPHHNLSPYISKPTEQSLKDHRSLERRLILQNTLREKDLQDIFAHGKPLVFDGEDYPRLLVPKIIEVSDFCAFFASCSFFQRPLTRHIPKRKADDFCVLLKNFLKYTRITMPLILICFDAMGLATKFSGIPTPHDRTAVPRHYRFCAHEEVRASVHTINAGWHGPSDENMAAGLRHLPAVQYGS